MLQIWYDMVYEYKIADPNVASREATVPYQDFLDGKVAMTLMNPWGMGLVTPESAVYEKSRSSLCRNIRTSRRLRSTPITGQSIPRRPTSATRSGVQAWSAFSPRSRAMAQERQLHPAPRRLERAAGSAEFPFYDVWAAEMLNGKFLPSPERPEIDNIIQQTIESSVLTGVPPQEAMDAAATQIEAVLAEVGASYKKNFRRSEGRPRHRLAMIPRPRGRSRGWGPRMQTTHTAKLTIQPQRPGAAARRGA